jgi:hypothetical protein
MEPAAAAVVPSKAQDSSRKRVTLAAVLSYLGCFVVAYLVPGFFVRHVLDPAQEAAAPRKFTTLAGKVRFYQIHASEYDLVFVGDSRTYCDLSPDELDARLGTRSVNLGMWANWFQTQYPSLEDLLPSAPPGAVVVWSIGHSNFDARNDSLNYPIGARNAARYLSWGYPLSNVLDNVIGLLPGLDLYATRSAVRSKIEATLGLPLLRAAEGQRPASAWTESQLDAVRREYGGDGRVLTLEPVEDGGEVTSVALHMSRGNYVRIELDHEYFRRKQKEVSTGLPPIRGGAYEPDPARKRNFDAILDLFVSRGIRLVVNEVEEAPYNYSDPGEKRQLREFMRRVREQVEQRGVPYVRVDWDTFSDSDYFDWNHLNRDGIVKYADQLAPLLRPVLGRGHARGSAHPSR